MTRLRSALAVPSFLAVLLSAGAAAAQAPGPAQPSPIPAAPSARVQAGYAIAIVGAIGGVSMIVASTDGGETVCGAPGVCYERTHVNAGLLAGGIVVVVVSVVTGALLGWRHDSGHPIVEPLRTASVSRSDEPSIDRLVVHAQPQGAALTWHF